MIQLPPSSFYYKPRRDRAERERQDAELRSLIEKVQAEIPGSGYRQVLDQLRRSGILVGERRVRNVMAKFGLWAEVKRAWVATTDSNHDYQLYPNLISGMKITGTNQVWASDITYIRIKNGFVYLAVILDLFSRKVIGWSLSRHIDTELCLNALRMALRMRKPPRGVIHHSDRGVQYVSDRYVRLLTKLGFHLSNSSKGNPYDNAFVESFMKTLKRQEVNLASYETLLDVLENVPHFIEEVHNAKRGHSSIDYLTPNELELMEKLDSNKTSRFEVNL
jgi:putative transposase